MWKRFLIGQIQIWACKCQSFHYQKFQGAQISIFFVKIYNKKQTQKYKGDMDYHCIEKPYILFLF